MNSNSNKLTGINTHKITEVRSALTKQSSDFKHFEQTQQRATQNIIDHLKMAFKDASGLKLIKLKNAAKLALKTIQEDINHSGKSVFTNQNYYGTILDDDSALQLFNQLITKESVLSGYSDLEILCTPEKALLGDIKLSFWKTNFTPKAIIIRNFIKNYENSEEKPSILKKSESSAFEKLGNTLAGLNSEQLKNKHTPNQLRSFLVESCSKEIGSIKLVAGKDGLYIENDPKHLSSLILLLKSAKTYCSEADIEQIKLSINNALADKKHSQSPHEAKKTKQFWNRIMYLAQLDRCKGGVEFFPISEKSIMSDDLPTNNVGSLTYGNAAQIRSTLGQLDPTNSHRQIMLKSQDWVAFTAADLRVFLAGGNSCIVHIWSGAHIDSILIKKLAGSGDKIQVTIFPTPMADSQLLQNWLSLSHQVAENVEFRLPVGLLYTYSGDNNPKGFKTAASGQDGDGTCIHTTVSLTNKIIRSLDGENLILPIAPDKLQHLPSTVSYSNQRAPENSKAIVFKKNDGIIEKLDLANSQSKISFFAPSQKLDGINEKNEVFAFNKDFRVKELNQKDVKNENKYTNKKRLAEFFELNSEILPQNKTFDEVARTKGPYQERIRAKLLPITKYVLAVMDGIADGKEDNKTKTSNIIALAKRVLDSTNSYPTHKFLEFHNSFAKSPIDMLSFSKLIKDCKLPDNDFAHLEDENAAYISLNQQSENTEKIVGETAALAFQHTIKAYLNSFNHDEDKEILAEPSKKRVAQLVKKKQEVKNLEPNDDSDDDSDGKRKAALLQALYY